MRQRGLIGIADHFRLSVVYRDIGLGGQSTIRSVGFIGNPLSGHSSCSTVAGIH